MSDAALSSKFGAELQYLAAMRRFVEDAAAALGADPVVIADIVQAVDESATNIVEHGYRGRPGTIAIELELDDRAVVVRLRDEAPPFDPTALPEPDLNLPLDQRPLGGMGVYLTRTLMDHVAHRVTAQGGNELTLIKRLPR